MSGTGEDVSAETSTPQQSGDNEVQFNFTARQNAADQSAGTIEGQTTEALQLKLALFESETNRKQIELEAENARLTLVAKLEREQRKHEAQMKQERLEHEREQRVHDAELELSLIHISEPTRRS